MYNIAEAFKGRFATEQIILRAAHMWQDSEEEAQQHPGTSRAPTPHEGDEAEPLELAVKPSSPGSGSPQVLQLA